MRQSGSASAISDAMFILVLKLDIHIPASNSLKHKRMILSSLKGKLRNTFNISVSEVGELDKWQRATIAISHVAVEREGADKTAEKILDFVGRFNGAELLTYEMEIL